MNRAVRKILLLAVGSVFVFSSVMVFRYHVQMRAAAQYIEELARMVVASSEERPESPSVTETVHVPTAQIEETISEQTDVTSAPLPEKDAVDEPSRTAPIQVDFDALREKNQDVVAWIYCPDTVIHYPVVQAADNERYLHRRLDGDRHFAGTLFMDYRNAEDLSDWNSVIYGHNMKDGSMFGMLTRYKKQAYYESHPEMYLLTPERDYVIRLLAGFVTTADAEIYNTFRPDDAEKARLVENWQNASDFVSENTPAVTDRLITLSTCSYEYDDARYVLIGILEELSK